MYAQSKLRCEIQLFIFRHFRIYSINSRIEFAHNLRAMSDEMRIMENSSKNKQINNRLNAINSIDYIFPMGKSQIKSNQLKILQGINLMNQKLYRTLCDMSHTQNDL